MILSAPSPSAVRSRVGRRAAGVGLGVAALLAFAFGWSRPRRVLVVGASMEPTLSEGDRLLVVRDRTVRTGDLVAFKDPTNRERIMVKRVVAVRRGEVVVRGDNSSASVDSRSFGPVPVGDLLGRVLRRYGPGGRPGAVS